MKQIEMAQALGITPGMVSRLVKRGMPTDSLERAQRWRKRHLEPGRVKGSRFNPAEVQAGVATGVGSAAPGRAKVDRWADFERLALSVEAALIAEPAAFCDLEPLRQVLRQRPFVDDRPRVPVRVWVALVDHALADDSAARDRQGLDRLATPIEFAALAAPKGHAGPFFGAWWLISACDDVEALEWDWANQIDGDLSESV